MTKFKSREDYQYKKVRARLAAVVEQITTAAKMSVATTTDIVKVPLSNHVTADDQLHTIKEYLGINADMEDELLELKEVRSEGSCMWLTEGEDFHRWLEEDSNTRYLWLKGPPAAGKSIMAAHVIGQLGSHSCSHFFFKHGSQLGSSISYLLRSLAFQMANKDVSMREALFKIASDDFQAVGDDYKVIWRKIFMHGILRQWPTEK